MYYNVAEHYYLHMVFFIRILGLSILNFLGPRQVKKPDQNLVSSVPTLT